MTASRSDSDRRLARSDTLWAMASGAVAFAAYVRTLAPGMVQVADTPMFQFIGRVLGVAHPPGYPLYVLLTYPFSYLPIGTLPYRINLFSAVAAAVTVAMTFLVARRLGCRTTISIAAALGLAFGPTFWSQATIAEVYTLNTAIIGVMVWLALEWGRTGRPGFLYASIAALAVGLGNHTTIVGWIPALAVYASIENRKFALRPRTILTAAAILTAGLLQYAFILFRSQQPNAYIESRATTLPALMNVVMARRFGFALFTYDWHTLLNERVPILVEGILVPEVTLPGLVLAAAGMLTLLRRRPAEGLLLFLAFAAIFGFVVNYSADDLPVFLIPGILVAWWWAASGAEQGARAIETRTRLMGATVAPLVFLLPIWNYSANLAGSDRSRRFETDAAFDSLFAALPDSSVLVHEDFLTDRMVNLKLLGERAAGTRRIEFLPADPALLRSRRDQGGIVFAFMKSARSLREQGVGVSFAPYRTFEAPLPTFLSRLPDGTLVAIAVPAAFRQQFEAHGAAELSAIGSDGLVPEARANVVIGIRGARAGAIANGALLEARARVDQHAVVGSTGFAAPATIDTWAGEEEAAVKQGGRDIVRSSKGAVIALWNPDGSSGGAFVLEESHQFLVPRLQTPASVYELRDDWPRRELPLNATWTEVTGAVVSGTFMMHLPGAVHGVLYIADDLPLAVRVLDVTSDSMQVQVTSFVGGSSELDRVVRADNFDASRFEAAQEIERIEFVSRPDTREPVAVLLAIGALPSHAFVRLDEPGDSPATMFTVNTNGLLHTPDAISEVLLMHRDDQGQLVGAGWSGVDSDGISPYRWLAGTTGRLVLALQGDSAAIIRLQTFWDGLGTSPALALRLNEASLPEQALHAGWHTYEWTVPVGALHRGFNDAAIVVIGRGARRALEQSAPGVAVAEVRVLHREPW